MPRNPASEWSDIEYKKQRTQNRFLGDSEREIRFEGQTVA